MSALHQFSGLRFHVRYTEKKLLVSCDIVRVGIRFEKKAFLLYEIMSSEHVT